MQRIASLQARLTPRAQHWKWLANLGAAILSGLAWTVLARLVEGQSIRAAFFEVVKFNARLWLTVLFLSLIVLTLELFAHNLLAGNAIVGVVVMILSFINYFKMLFTSTPLQIGDFGLIGQVGDIAKLNSSALTLSRNSILAILGAVLWLAVTWFFSKPLRISWKWSAVGGLGTGVVFFLLFLVGLNVTVLKPLGAGMENVMTQTTANQSCGSLLGLWRSFYALTPFSGREVYSATTVQEALKEAERYTEDVPAPIERDKPNIILVLSESFFDITTLDNVAFPTDPVADFHALQTEGVSGKFYTRSLGYGTCNIELEVFCGLNTGLLSGQDLYTCSPDTFARQPSVPTILRENGYRTSMLHMFNDSIYNRQELFKELGFEKMYFSEDFAQFYQPAAQAADYWAYLDTRMSGGFYSDDLMSDLIIAQYEAGREQGDGPQFLYASSVEGHQPYPADKYSPEELTLELSANLTGEAADALRIYCQGVTNASAALGKLVDYFRTCDEPTVIVFYGDHKPGLGLSTGGRVYQDLGIINGGWDTWDEADYAYLYSAEYLVWSNDPDYLPGEPGSTWDTSCSYMGSELLRLAGVEMPLYWKLIYKLAQTRVADAAEFHLDRAGTLTRQAPAEGADADGLSMLRLLVVDALDGGHAATGSPQETPNEE